jgi:hypothetical protein
MGNFESTYIEEYIEDQFQKKKSNNKKSEYLVILHFYNKES